MNIDLVKLVEETWKKEGSPKNVNLVFALTCLQKMEEQLILLNSCELSKEKDKTVIVGFENYIGKIHPDPDSVLIDNLERWKQIVLLAEKYANQ